MSLDPMPYKGMVITTPKIPSYGRRVVFVLDDFLKYLDTANDFNEQGVGVYSKHSQWFDGIKFSFFPPEFLL